jgi:hypothetical protein
MSHEQQNNGTPQLQGERNSFNQKVGAYSILGRTKKVQWSNRRRWRTI